MGYSNLFHSSYIVLFVSNLPREVVWKIFNFFGAISGYLPKLQMMTLLPISQFLPFRYLTWASEYGLILCTAMLTAESPVLCSLSDFNSVADNFVLPIVAITNSPLEDYLMSVSDFFTHAALLAQLLISIRSRPHSLLNRLLWCR